MQICQKHWAKCRAAIEGHGLTHLIKTGEENMQREVDHMNGEEVDSKDFDPLWSLNSMLWSRGLEVMGLGAMNVDETKKDDAEANNGHICPLCECRKAFDMHATPTGTCGDPACKTVVKPGDQPWDEEMIDGASEAVFRHCKNAGLVTTQ